MAGKDRQDFETIAIKSTRYGLIPRTGARLTYEVIFLHGSAHFVQDLRQNIHGVHLHECPGDKQPSLKTKKEGEDQ